MDIYPWIVWIAVSVAGWCVVGCISGLVLARLIALGSRPFMLTSQGQLAQAEQSNRAMGR